MAEEEGVRFDGEENGAPEILITISQLLSFKKMVDEGKFASVDDAINASRETLQLVKVGEDSYSAEAYNRVTQSIHSSNNDGGMTSEEVDAYFENWFREIEARTNE